MKQGTFFTRIIFVVVLVALVAYGVFAAFSSMKTSITTTTALAYEAGEGLSTTGFVVRDEELIHSNNSINVLTRTEGEKVSKGSVIATTYENTDAQLLQNEITSLEEQIAQLQYVYDSSSSKLDSADLDSQILTSLTQCAVYTARGSLSSVLNAATGLKSQVLRRYMNVDNIDDLSTQITQLNSQLNSLKKQISTGTSSVTAELSGYFSGSVDGYESLLSSERLKDMSTSDYEALTKQTVTPPSSAIGKLITSSIWYYVTEVDADQVKDYKVGDQMSVTFAYDFYDQLDMYIWRLSDESNGKRLLVLSCNDYLWDATHLRSQAADVVSHSYSGLRVPKSAIYYSDDSSSAGVYVLEGSNAVWKNVSIIYDLGESYIVKEDKSSINNLWPGDEIIVTTQELFDGKVVS